MQTMQERVAETTTTTGTGDLTLAGALTGARTFNAVFGVTPRLIPTLIEAVDANGAPTGEWEVSLCELTAATTLARRLFWQSSTGSTVNFAAGTKHVYASPLALGARLGIMGSRLCWAETDFFGGTGAIAQEIVVPWDVVLVSSGTQAKIAGDANHPGIWQCSSSATANSGAYIRTDATAFLLGGGEYSEHIFRIVTLTNTTIRLGFFDTATSTDATDGAYIEIPSTGAAVGKTANNAVRTTSATIATLATNTWYKAVIAVNYNATAVWFALYDASNTLLGSATITTNIPTAAGRETGHGAIATNAGTTALALLQLDYMAVGILRPLSR